MDRREFLRTSGGVAAAAVAAGSAAAASEQPDEGASRAAEDATVLRLAMPWPDDGKGFGDSARRLARRIEAATAGRYRIDIIEGVPSGIEAVRSGAADLYHVTEHHNVGLHPAFAYFAGLPWQASLSASDLESWLLVGGGQALWDGLAADFGVKPLLAGHTGPAALWSTRPLETLADVAGARIHATGLAAGVLKGIGAEPVPLAPQEIKGALASGALVAAEYGGEIAAMSLGLPEAAPRAYATALTAAGSALSLGIGQALWERMSEADKAAIAAAAAEEVRVTLAEARSLREPIAIAMTSRFGVERPALGADIRDAIARIGNAVVAHAAGFDATASRINASYMGFITATPRDVA